MIVALDTLAVGYGMTGVGRYAAGLAQVLPQEGSHRYLIVTRDDDETVHGDGNGTVQATIKSPGRPLWHHLELPGELASWDVDVYHSPLFTCPLVKVCRYVVTLHDAIPASSPEYCQPEFARFFDHWASPCLELADIIVTVSQYSREDILRHLDVPAEKVVVVPECVSPAFHSRQTEEESARVLSKYGIGASFILYVGSIERRKNVDGLLEAYSRLPSSLRDSLPLVIVGQRQPDAVDVDEIAMRLGIHHQLIIPGYVLDEELAVLYRAARMFVFPSRYEGFGLPVLEAMASETPVIASTVTSLPEVAGDAAMLVDPDDVDSLAAAMERLNEDEELRAQLIERGRGRVAEFSPQTMAIEMGKVYDMLGGEG